MKAQKLILKRTNRPTLSLILCMTLFILLLFSACDDQRMQTITRIEFQPVYMTDQEFKDAVQMDEPRELKNPGKIYLHDGYLFINELNKGVHIIDNSDPAAPSKVGFITIPANKDIAVKGERLYADSNRDLVVFDISDLQNAEVIARKKGVFERFANQPPGILSEAIDPEKGIVVDWKRVEVEEVCEGDCSRGVPNVDWALADGVGFNQAGGESSGGIGGSTARFAITGDHLFAVDNSNLVGFDITDPEPIQVSQKEVGWAIETIFPYKESLFIGSRSAMYIFSISNPAAPVKLSDFPHSTACDPVVVEGDIAYVTLRNGPGCPQGLNRLEVIDVADLLRPERISFYEMKNPHGLGIDDGNLFVGEGNKGLRIMDAQDPNNVKQLRHITDITAKDVIPFNNVLIVTGGNGIVQYDYSDINNLELLSTIPVVGEEEGS